MRDGHDPVGSHFVGANAGAGRADRGVGAYCGHLGVGPGGTGGGGRGDRFIAFTGGAWLGVGPVVTVLAVSALPLLVLVVLQRQVVWRPTLPWLRVGRLDRWVWVLAVSTILVAAVALTMFAVFMRPDVSPYLRALRSLQPCAGCAGCRRFRGRQPGLGGSPVPRRPAR